LWPGVRFPEGIKAVLSMAVSNSECPSPTLGKRMAECTEKELVFEALRQIGFDALDNVRGYHLSRDVAHVGQWSEAEAGPEPQPALYRGNGAGGAMRFDAPLFVVKPGTAKKVGNQTDVENLYVAGEFTNTTLLIPTMEQVSESGKRCAREICRKHGLPYDTTRFRVLEMRPAVGFLIGCLKKTVARLRRLRSQLLPA
jgi:hypothetical protein